MPAGIATHDEDLTGLGNHCRRRTEHVRRCFVGQRKMRVRGNIPYIVDQLRALLAELIGTVGQDLAVGCQDAMDADDRPVEDAAPLTTGTLKCWHELISRKRCAATSPRSRAAARL